MKKFLKTVSAFLVALSMAALPVTASADHHGGGGRNSHFSSGQRPNGGSNSPRPNGNHNGGSQRPNGNHGGSGNHNGGGQRPNGNHGGSGNHNGWRPNGHPGNGHNPGNAYRPGNGHRPGRPTPPPPPYHGSGPHRHHIPFFGHYHRPTPPPHWRPTVYGPSFGTILGVTIGTTIDLTLRTLLNQGYTVTSYGNNVVYLSNVPQMNYYWPDAAMYYNNGALCGSTFTYTSNYYDMSRYNALYNTFCGQYGVPVRTVNQGGVISSTWFGGNNRYVTLEFNSSYGNYYTSLSFGI